ncbi:MAG: hypothetical protein AMXMBFR33_13260 [Candidatus Xenobia bacterium]|jgi:outer membrane protein insertion porin family
MRLIVLLLLLLTLPLSAQTDSPEEPRDDGRHSAGRVRLGGDEGFGAGTATSDPTALEGPSRIETVLFNSRRFNTVDLTLHYLRRLSDNQDLLLEVQGGPTSLGGDFSYSFSDHLTVNVSGSSGRNPAFEQGLTRVYLANGEEPYFRSLGGGLEYSDQPCDELGLAAALNYQAVTVGDSLLGPVVAPPVDQLGNRLTFSPGGHDELLTLNFVGQLNILDQMVNPSDGTRLRFQLEQAIPVGDSQITSTTAAANLAQLVPMPGPGEGSSYLLINLQGGAIGGDVPPYRAFNLGGSNSVRGYQLGGLSTGSSFLQATLEYRGSLTRFELLGHELELKGVLFFDYGSDLGTADRVLGQPGVARQKPGEGIGYGAGLYFFSDVGLFRLEAGWNQQGQNQLFFTLGDRF